MGAVQMKNDNIDNNDFYQASFSEGLVTISENGVLSRNIIATLRSKTGKKIASRALSKRKK